MKQLSFAYSLIVDFESGFVRKDGARVWPTEELRKPDEFRYPYDSEFEQQGGILVLPPDRSYVQWVGNSFPDPDNSLLSYTDINPVT